MIIIPQTPITEKSFSKWKSHKIEVNEEEDTYYYFVIPLVDVNPANLENIETLPTLFSSYSDEFVDSEDGTHQIYTVRLDTHLPEMTTEQEVELLYKILTKKDLYL